MADKIIDSFFLPIRKDYIRSEKRIFMNHSFGCVCNLSKTEMEHFPRIVLCLLINIAGRFGNSLNRKLNVGNQGVNC